MTNQTEETILGVQVEPEQTIENYMDALVGEGKKYKSAEELARAYLNADMHIKELRDKLDERTKNDNSLEEVIKILRSQNGAETPAPQAPVNPAQAVTSPEDVTKAVERVLTDRERKLQIAENQKKSLQLLTEHYGSDKTALMVIKKVINGDAKLREFIDNLGNSNPEALKKFIVSQMPEVVEGPQTPAIADKPSAAVILPSKGLTWSQAKQIKKENPKLYNSPAFRSQLEKAAAAAMAKGEDFYRT
jgi:hypothetical protein